jgi:hypothetical protein
MSVGSHTLSLHPIINTVESPLKRPSLDGRIRGEMDRASISASTRLQASGIKYIYHQ